MEERTVTLGNPKIQFRVPQETLDAWSRAAMAAGQGLNGWIRETCDRGASPAAAKKSSKTSKSPKKSKSISSKRGLQVVPIEIEPEKKRPTGGGDIPPSTSSPFTAPEIVEIGAGEKPISKKEANVFKAKQDARKKWDRQYKRLPAEIQEAWAEENPRP